MTHHDRLTAATADLRKLNADELAAVHYLIAKLIAGGVKHGQLDLASDRRNWTQEMLEEFADAAFYAAFARVQREQRTAPLADLAGLAARESAPDYSIAAAVAALGPAAVAGSDVISDDWFTRHPLGSPERVQAVEEHRAAVVAHAALAANHAEEM